MTDVDDAGERCRRNECGWWGRKKVSMRSEPILRVQAIEM